MPDDSLSSNHTLLSKGRGVQSALPSRLARGIAVLSILVGGLCGALIGFAFVDISCSGDCTAWKGAGILAGAVITALGVSIVAILTLRAMDEWETIQARDAISDRPIRGQQ